MRSRTLFRLLPLLLLALGSAREAAAQACLSTQGSNEYCKALTAGVRFGFPRYTTAALPTCNTSNKGAVAFDTTAGSYKGCDGSTWAAIGFSGGTITSPILAPAANNCASVPYSFTSDATSGMCSSSSGIVDLYSGGGAAARFSANGLFATGTNGVQVNSTGVFSFSSGTAGAAAGDLFLYRDAANTLALRNSTNAQKFIWNYSYTDGSNYQQGALKTSASGISIEAETAGSGADNLDITLTPAGTGQIKIPSTSSITGTNGLGLLASGASPIMYWDVNGIYPTSGTTLDVGFNSNGARWRTLYYEASSQGSKTKALTEGAATAVTQIAVPQTAGSNSADAVVQWTVYASDGTDTQTRRGSTYLAAVNAAGTETCTVGDIGTPVVAVSAGTLTCTTSCITGLSDVVQFALDCTSSLTQTSLNAMVRLDMDQPNTVTPQ